MENEIKKGIVVKLKSGGPKMTVKYERSGLWICTWFVSDEVRQADFSKEQLEVVK